MKIMLDLAVWPYLKSPVPTGNLKEDAVYFFTANDKAAEAEHVLQVAEIIAVLAAAHGMETAPAAMAALLHDIGCVMQPADMLAYAVSCGWELDDTEKRRPGLLHQRVSAVFARELFGVGDAVVLSAIECHSTLKHSPTNYDLLLFVADKLSWPPESAPFRDVLMRALEVSLPAAALAYINYALNNGLMGQPHQWLLAAKRDLESLSATS